MQTQKIGNEKTIMTPLFKKLMVGAIVSLLLLALLVGALAAYNGYLNSGKAIRKVTVLESESFTLTLPMYAYYYRSMQSGSNPDLVAMSLAEQLALYEAALADGDTLSEDRSDILETQIQSFWDSAKKLDISIDEYLSINYGRGIKMDDIRALLEMTALAAQKYDSLWESISVSEGEMAEYCKDNEEVFLYSDYLFYVFSVPLTEKQSTAEKEQLIAKYEAYANRLAMSENAEAFLEAVVSYEEQFAQDADKTVTFTEGEIAAIRQSVIYERSPYIEYTESDDVVKEINEWLFDGARKIGDNKVTPYVNLNKNIATFGVYYMTRPLYTNTDPTHTIYDIRFLFSKYTQSAAETNAKNAKDAYQKSPTEATLKELAAQYGGGICKNTACTMSLDTDLYNWLKQPRTEGDMLMYEASDGWHVVCYVEEGIPECYAQAESILKNAAYNDQMKSYRDAHSVTVAPNSYKELPELRYGWFIL